MQIPFKQSLKRLHVDTMLMHLSAVAGFTRAKIGIIDRTIIANYLSQNPVRKLHIGCGDHILRNGWLNCDYNPVPVQILHLDATRRFPFKSDEFDFIFSEHMIEHVSYAKGALMLSECFRVLKPSGIIRLSTPNLSFLVKLHSGPLSESEKSYIDWATKTWIKNAPYNAAVFVINNFVRGWGHQFIYDEDTLHFALQRAGFSQITKCEINQSEHEELKNLENETRLPTGLLKLETLTLEATKCIPR